jgi:hypothetical protein
MGRARVRRERRRGRLPRKRIRMEMRLEVNDRDRTCLHSFHCLRLGHSDGSYHGPLTFRRSQRESSARLPSTLPSPPPTSAVSSSKRSNANPSTDFAPAKRQKKISPSQPAPTIPSPPQDRTINLTSHAAASFSGSHVNPSVDRIPTPPSNSSPTDEEELPAGPSTSAANPDASAQDEDSQPSLPPLAADSAQALGKMYLLDSDSASHSQHSSRSPSASSSQQPLVLKSPNTKHQFSHPFLPRSMLSANNSPISQNRSVRESSESQASEPDVFASMIDRFSNVRGQVPSSSDDEEGEGEGDRTIVAGTGEGGIEVHEAEEQEDGAETQAINALLRQHNPPFPPIASRSRSNAPPSSSAAAAFEPAVPSLLASGPAAASLRAGKTKTMRSASGGVIRKRPSIGVVEGADEAVPFLEFDRKVSAGPGMEAKKGGGKKRGQLCHLRAQGRSGLIADSFVASLRSQPSRSQHPHSFSSNRQLSRNKTLLPTLPPFNRLLYTSKPPLLPLLQHLPLPDSQLPQPTSNASPLNSRSSNPGSLTSTLRTRSPPSWLIGS